MTTQVADRTAKPTPPVGRWDRIAAWSLLVVLALTYVAAALVGERESNIASLRQEIGSGDVTEVRLADPGAGPDARGYWSVTIRWREHGLRYVTTVTQASSERQARRVKRSADEVVVGDVAGWLTTNGREVSVAGPTTMAYGAATIVAGFGVPMPFFWVKLVTVCATLLLIGAIEPWRATRWGWAWLALLTPVGVPLFLLFGGLTGLFPPRPGARRLTGGWSFLLASAIGASLR